MDLYGKIDCIYHGEVRPNPYYMFTCNQGEKSAVKQPSDCKNCSFYRSKEKDPYEKIMKRLHEVDEACQKIRKERCSPKQMDGLGEIEKTLSQIKDLIRKNFQFPEEAKYE